MKKIKEILKFLLFLCIGIFFIWLSFKDLTKVQINEIIYSFKLANYNWLLLSFLAAIISHIIRALRWRMLLEPLGYYPRLGNVTFAVVIGYFANLALPRLGEVTRCGTLTKYEKISFTKSFGTVITERAFDVITFFILFFINLFIQFDKIHSYFYDKIYLPYTEKYSNINLSHIGIGLGVAIFCLFIFIFVLRKRISHLKLYIKIKETILGFWHGIMTITRVKKPFLFILYSILIWLGYFLSTYVCLFCFKSTETLGLGSAFAILVFGSIGVMITPGGIGAYTFIVAGVLINVYSLNPIDANAFGWMVWFSQTIVIVLAGTLSFLIISSYNKKYIPQTVNI